MAQFLRPDSDVATGAWTATPLWSKIDEGSPGDDTTISSDNNTSPDNADFTTTDASDPQSSSNHVLRAAWSKDSSGGHAITAVLELWQGVPDTGTLIATLSVVDIGATEQEDSYTLTATEADSITDYTALHLRLSRQGETGGNPNGRRSLVVDFVELEVPDATVSSTVDANLVGPVGSVASDIDVTVAVDSSLTGPVGTLTSDVDVVVAADGSLTAPIGSLSADVSAQDSRTVDSALTGPSPTVSSAVDVLISVDSSLSGPIGSLSSDTSVKITTDVSLSGPLPSVSGSAEVVVEGTVDGALVGPTPNVTSSAKVLVELSSSLNGPVGSVSSGVDTGSEVVVAWMKRRGRSYRQIVTHSY